VQVAPIYSGARCNGIQWAEYNNNVVNNVNNHVVNNHVVNNHNHVVNNNANNDANKFVATLASVAVRGVLFGLTGVMF
jgi:hypothetical protein